MPIHLPGPSSSGSPKRAASAKATSEPSRLPAAPARIASAKFIWPVAARTPALGMMTSLGNGMPQLSAAMRSSTARTP